MATALRYKELFFEGDGADDRTIVMLHGFGGNAHIMASLGGLTKIPGRWLFPEPRIAVEPERWAWYPRTQEGIARSLRESDYVPSLRLAQGHRDGEDFDSGFAEARQDLDSFLEEHDVDISKMWIGGFSQGAIMAADLIMRRLKAGRSLPYGAMLMSGLNIYGESFADTFAGVHLSTKGEVASGLSQLPRIFVSHGERDEVLPYAWGLELAASLESLGLPVHFHSFGSGHKLYTRELRAMKQFILEE